MEFPSGAVKDSCICKKPTAAPVRTHESHTPGAPSKYSLPVVTAFITMGGPCESYNFQEFPEPFKFPLAPESYKLLSSLQKAMSQ